ncbi:pentapeptide repeat-containing protein [Nonomuraea basaltis]|uniref:pentapeptide repeat-containing protein n=1 Tax=Nonomuraea basaltis TaxID=2495887 RepID=UPI00110C4AE8|nr:pentapeptide repeat-containing protein [Nonomuraea basaltis]TMR94917.1 pentapeptide repeat-containing protein [Nonomuraea basaltis]
MPRSMWWWALPAALLIGAAVWGTTEWLLRDVGTVPVEQISVRIEAARTALAAAAGVGAAVTLLLAVRRQRHQELATAHTTHDAAERRTTELYTKAADQLGSDQAPVRLAGLYALERLAEHTPALQQRVVDVICAYLRMPFTPLAEQDRHEKIRASQRAAGARARSAQRAARARPIHPDADRGRDPYEERQVRLTAQRILADHLRYQDPPARRRWQLRSADSKDRHWRDIRLDLTGATLIDFDLDGCRMRDALFREATFTGRHAGFRATTFTGDVRFSEATFTNNAWFQAATFTGNAGFRATAFTGDAEFSEATFTGDVRFSKATFIGSAEFSGATGLELAELDSVRVAPPAGDVERRWPPAWRVEQAADGWQTLRLAPRPGEEGAGAAGVGPGPEPKPGAKRGSAS